MRVLRGAALSVRYRPRAVTATAVFAVVAFAAVVLTLGSGDYRIAPAEVLRTLFGGGTVADHFIVVQLRLPRVVTALLVGAALALAGAVFQSLVRNPLGSPDMLGFTEGAATGALVVVVAGGSSAALACGAVAGGVATGIGVYVLAWRRGVHGYRLILAGIGVSAILSGVNGYLLTKAQLMDATRALLWITGSLDGRAWADAVPLAIAMAVLVPVVLITCSRALHVMEMGDDTAAALGVSVERVRLTALVAAVLLTSFAAAAAGPVSFVALTSPQLAKRLTRAPGPNLIPSMLLGAVLMTCADLAAQHAIPGRQLPVGVVTGVLGGGYLMWLLATGRKAGRI
ncbi:iron chelate uptake ABC transporter family permease subunit [Catenulispora sp. NF23]|uniref:Iron chelate uptake ABC transporter family permease subunit n=1 Tax=Catenulispora pinistramenti TaxID=2705254 RepID=A0ABS5KTU4_9ACTN|nr:iron chelate uptake ABC transporter family permease subunit [Catenulispora pinistramenti]MBS2533690.1 iron chelate uptake ABC transporter family permease subunit [Catenulispora pinistramenti]MBS2549430.1 iron chelate uptake ABC transporter family permease subunit [Catenulispora pinistramenti]